MILEPGVFEITITMDLTQLEIVKISSLIVITQDRAATPIGVTTAVFILQAIP